MVRIVEDYTIGDGLLETTTHGPLQNFLQYEKVKTFFDDIKKEGWKVAAGGEVQPSSGYFIKPTIIDRPADESRIVVEEQFGRFTCTPRQTLFANNIQVLSFPSSPGKTSKMLSPALMTVPWASAHPSGPVMSTKPTSLRQRSKRVVSGSMLIQP